MPAAPPVHWIAGYCCGGRCDVSVISESLMSGSRPVVDRRGAESLCRVAVLPSDGRAAVAARSVVRSVCARWGVDGAAELAVGCVSELAANAARHVLWDRVPFGERLVLLVVELWGPLLVVEVRDPSTVLPRVGEGIDLSWLKDAPGEVRRLPESGMGLRLVVDQVAQVAGVFGAVKLPCGGKSVFFAVPCGVGW